jgi:hypothetical protein
VTDWELAVIAAARRLADLARQYESSTSRDRSCEIRDAMPVAERALLDAVHRRAVFGSAPEKSLDDMTIEELEARFHIMRDRQALLWWGGFVAGFGGGAFGGFKLIALAAKAALVL